MDLLDQLNEIWVDIACSFLMLSFLIFVCCLVWQHLKNKRDQAEIIAQYKQNLEILQNLKNRY